MQYFEDSLTILFALFLGSLASAQTGNPSNTEQTAPRIKLKEGERAFTLIEDDSLAITLEDLAEDDQTLGIHLIWQAEATPPLNVRVDTTKRELVPTIERVLRDNARYKRNIDAFLAEYPPTYEEMARVIVDEIRGALDASSSR